MVKNTFLAFIAFIFVTSAFGQVRVAVIDTGLNLHDTRFPLCKIGHKDFTKSGIVDTYGHGTHVAGLIKQYADSDCYCLIILKYFPAVAPDKTTLMAIKEAIELRVDIVNYSSAGPQYSPEEYSLIKNHPEILFVVAAGNQGYNLDFVSVYPASYNLPNIIVVGSKTKDNKRSKASNYGSIVSDWEIGSDLYSTLPNGRMGYDSGTSMSTAVRTGKIIHNLCEK